MDRAAKAEAMLNDTKSQAQDTASRVAEAEARADAAETGLGEMKGRLKNATSRAAKAENELKSAQSRAVEAESDLETAQKRATDAESKAEAASARATEAESKLKAAEIRAATDAETKAKELATRASDAQQALNAAEQRAKAAQESASSGTADAERRAETVEKRPLGRTRSCRRPRVRGKSKDRVRGASHSRPKRRRNQNKTAGNVTPSSLAKCKQYRLREEQYKKKLTAAKGIVSRFKQSMLDQKKMIDSIAEEKGQMDALKAKLQSAEQLAQRAQAEAKAMGPEPKRPWKRLRLPRVKWRMPVML